MRIIHTSDWHLGQHFYGKSRAYEHQQFLAWLIEQSQSQNIDAIIVAGDIFDTGTPPSYAREMYFDFIAKLHQTRCQLVVLAGNHDSVAMLSESQKLLQQLSTRVISAVSDDIDEQVFVLNSLKTDQKAVICAIPFIRPRDIIKSYAGQSANEKQRSLQQAISMHYQHLFEQAQVLSNEYKINDARLPIIATGHLTTIGASSSESVRDIYIGTLEAFPASEFPDADYIALGHIHRPQKVTKSEHIRYSGSPIALSFDEVKSQKSIVVVDFTYAEIRKLESTSVELAKPELAKPELSKQELKNRELTNVDLVKVEICNVPCFQPLAMVKTNLDNLSTDITALVETHNMAENYSKQSKLWLDIEIESASYLQDLSARIEQLTQQLPVEVLLVRRSKKSRQAMPSNQAKVTLSELSVQEVFDERMALEQWHSDEQLQRKARLNILYRDIAEQVQLNASNEDPNVEAVGKTVAETLAKVEQK